MLAGWTRVALDTAPTLRAICTASAKLEEMAELDTRRIVKATPFVRSHQTPQTPQI
jgi:hypothetical protein